MGNLPRYSSKSIELAHEVCYLDSQNLPFVVPVHVLERREVKSIYVEYSKRGQKIPQGCTVEYLIQPIGGSGQMWAGAGDMVIPNTMGYARQLNEVSEADLVRREALRLVATP